MKLCYQVATPDVAVAPSVTAYQGSLDESFSALARLGYDGAELMTLDPDRLDPGEVKRKAAQYGLCIPLVCTGEVFGQLGLSFADPNEAVREEAIGRVCRIIDFAGQLDADINIGRVRGQYRDGVPRENTEAWAVEGFRRIAAHAAPLGVRIALETVTIMQTNFINTLAEGAKAVDRVGMDNFRLMMDVFHLNLEERDIYQAIRDFADYNIHVHLADNNRRYPGHCGLDFERIVECLCANGYDGAYSTEIFQIPDQDAAARGAVEHLEPIFRRVYGRTRPAAKGETP